MRIKKNSVEPFNILKSNKSQNLEQWSALTQVVTKKVSFQIRKRKSGKYTKIS